MLIGLYLYFVKNLFLSIFLSEFKINHPIELEDYFLENFSAYVRVP